MSNSTPARLEQRQRDTQRVWEALPAAIAFTVRHAYAEIPPPGGARTVLPPDRPGGEAFRPTRQSRQAARETLIARGLLRAEEFEILSEDAASALAVRRFRGSHPSPPGR